MTSCAALLSRRNDSRSSKGEEECPRDQKIHSWYPTSRYDTFEKLRAKRSGFNDVKKGWARDQGSRSTYPEIRAIPYSR